MKKPILATNIDDLLIKHKAFIEPHKAWFDRAIKKTGDKSLKKWKNKKDYFLGVFQAMEQLMPRASKKARTKQARKWYQNDVISYIRTHPSCVYKTRVKKLRNLKNKYKLILITTNTKTHIQKILKAAKLNKLYNGIIASKIDQEPSKQDLIKQLVKKYGKPEIYLTGKSESEIIKEFKKRGIKILIASKLEKL